MSCRVVCPSPVWITWRVGNRTFTCTCTPGREPKIDERSGGARYGDNTSLKVLAC
jgi:hypothetical protein